VSANDWNSYCEENVLALLELKTPMLAKTLAGHLGISAADLANVKNKSRRWFTIERKNYLAALAELREFEGHNWLGSELQSSDPKFRGLAELFKLAPSNVTDAIANLCGTYISYRYSFLLRNSHAVLRGLVTIFPNEYRDAIQTFEINRVQREEGFSRPEIFFERNGYFLYQSPISRLISFKADSSNDSEVICFQMPLVRGAGDKKERVNTISGFIFDWQRLEPYMTAIRLVRVSDDVKPPSQEEIDHDVVRAVPDNDPSIAGEIEGLRLFFENDGKIEKRDLLALKL
jgi:hypothetical protein